MSIHQYNPELHKAIDIAYSEASLSERGVDYYDEYIPALHEIQRFSDIRADQITMDIFGHLNRDIDIDSLIRKGIRQGYKWAVSAGESVELEQPLETSDVLMSEYVMHGPGGRSMHRFGDV